MLAPLGAVVDALRDYRLTVVEDPGWIIRGTGHRFEPIAQMFHHDALSEAVSDAVALSIMRKGRPDLAGPLCNGWIDSDSTVVLVAAGNANHAGRGEADVLDRMVKGLAPLGDAVLDPDKDGPVGNVHFWGWECRNAGDGRDPWDQLDAMERAGAALADVCGWGPNRIAGHREWTARKVDPRGFDMHAFRADVARILTTQPLPLPGGPMQLEPLNIERCPAIAEDWYRTFLGKPPGPAEVRYVTRLLTDPAKTYLAAYDEWHATASQDPAYKVPTP